MAPTATDDPTAAPPDHPPAPAEWDSTASDQADTRSHESGTGDNLTGRRDERPTDGDGDGDTDRNGNVNGDTDRTGNGDGATTRTGPDGAATGRGQTDPRPDGQNDPEADTTGADAADLPCTLSTHGDAHLSEGIPTKDGYARSTGTVHALTLMIDFPDTPGEGTARQRFAEFFPQTSRWFTRGSYGRLDYRPATPIRHWLRMPRPFTAYGIDRGSPYEPGYQRLLKDIVAAADERVDFGRYDLVNVLVTPNAGPPAAHTVLSVTFADNDRAPRADGVRLSNVSFVYSRQDDGTGSLRETGYRVLPHENNHSFGLPDLYTASGADRAGHWDLMSEDWGANNDILGWHKWKLGWLGARQVACATESPDATARAGISRHTLTPLARPGGTKVVFLPVSRRGGYVMEARMRGGNDAAVCRPGVLIYWVDVHKDSGQGPVTVMDSTHGTDPRHPHRPPGAAPPPNGPTAGAQGCTRLPNVHAGLSDATFTPGQTFTDNRHGVRVSITVTDHTRSGDYAIRITRRGATS
ncbi:M6 family metalloprotease domain-containing protein [Streptomyces sp. 71268]|uniref:M6 family metalloprotease domain-containing protein n=1 Tax=Streptomyces sp. 71268 TaxID=3002640 RepID=UPI0023F7D506|nr:M6 family metalloprotease domain-containing protein [Streptomyces sp. 71268]WEV25868.1 M6 family metalloprotease domain-containing protein [Streptomyces sp. 71268]